MVLLRRSNYLVISILILHVFSTTLFTLSCPITSLIIFILSNVLVISIASKVVCVPTFTPSKPGKAEVWVPTVK